MASPAPRHIYQVERGTADDLDAVMSVMDSSFGNQFGEAWTRSQCSGILPLAGINLVLSRAADDIIGFALARTVADEAELLLIAVAPDHHRRGIGSMLLDDFIHRSQASGVARVHLEVRDGNPAIAMYRRAGFTPVGRRRDYYLGQDGNRFDALTFARDIPPKD
ncbi:MAG: GNAT family N-acetyltransferase [Pseudomonadota bacterium]